MNIQHNLEPLVSEWAGAHVQGPCAHDVVTTCAAGAPVCSGPRSGLTSDWLVQAP